MNMASKEKIENLIKHNHVVLFMKGNRERPQCGFSKRVVDVLNQYLPDYATCDVLQDPEIRDGIKVYSSWPTIPQLYIDGEFIGGCDIVEELAKKGDLAVILKTEKSTQAPTINLSQTALEAFKNALLESGNNDECIRIKVAANFEHALSFDKAHPQDFVLKFDGLTVLIDPFSAVRANGMSLDFTSDNLESGFSFDNPNEPAPIEELSVEELAKWHKEGQNFTLIDVRPESEWKMAHISFAKPLEKLSDQEKLELDKNAALVFHCHHGGRSRRSAEAWRFKGFKKIYNLAGGIDAWSRKIDSKVPCYNK
jgi:monothiol glutaredoxin